MSNLYRILGALASRRGICVDEETTSELLELIGQGPPTTDGLKLIYETLKLIRPAPGLEASFEQDLAVSELQYPQARSLSAGEPHFGGSELFRRDWKPFAYSRCRDDTIVIQNDPVSPSQYRTAKVKTATIEHAQRMQLARIKREMNANFESERMQGSACYSYGKQIRYDEAANALPTLEKTYRELRESKWM